MAVHTIEIDVPHALIGGSPPTRPEVEAAVASVKTHYDVAWCEDQSRSWFELFPDYISVRLHTVSRSESERSQCNTSKQRERLIGEIIGYLRCSRASHIRDGAKNVNGAEVIRTGPRGHRVNNLRVDDADAHGIYDVQFIDGVVVGVIVNTKETVVPSDPRCTIVIHRAREALQAAAAR